MPEKLQTLLLILMGVAALIVRWWKKAQETTQREQQERRLARPDKSARPRPVVPALPATSFQELLKQMQAQNQSPAKPGPTRSATAPAAETTTPAGRPLPREQARGGRSLERTEVRPVSLEAPATDQAFNKPAPEVRRASARPRPAASAESNYRGYRQEAPRPGTGATVAERLRNPADLRAAFVLSEILNRRYE